jgi:hypothetical protein
MEHNSLPIIVCYLGGTCGDLISAMIDPQGAYIENASVKHLPERMGLKKPHLFSNNADKNLYLTTVADKFLSVPSHDLEYHVKQQHDFISIVTESMDIAKWAADRFRSLHRPQVWIEMQQKCGAIDENSYAQIVIDFSKLVAQHTQKVVLLDSIVKGSAVSCLEEMLDIKISSAGIEFYAKWLECQNRL